MYHWTVCKDSQDLKYESLTSVKDEDDSCNLFKLIIYVSFGQVWSDW